MQVQTANVLELEDRRERATCTCTVIIPAYDEENGLGVVLEKLCNIVDESYQVIVVNDGSVDRTAEVARRFPVEIITHPFNKGKAAAVRTGIEAARGEAVILIDADDTYPVDLIPEIASKIGDFDMVITSRSDGREHIPLFNRAGNRMFQYLLRYIYGFKPEDPLTGMYGLRRSVLLNMNLNSSGFGIETEVAIKAGRMDLKILEIPIEYRPRIGESKLNCVRDGILLLKTICNALALFSPTLFFVVPSLLLLGTGILLMGLLAIGPVDLAGITLRTNTSYIAAMLGLAGVQTLVFGIGLDLYASAHRFAKPGFATRFFLRKYINGNMVRLGSVLVLLGAGVLVWIVYDWTHGGFGPFTRSNALVFSSFLAIMGLQFTFTSSFLSVFVAEYRRMDLSYGVVPA